MTAVGYLHLEEGNHEIDLLQMWTIFNQLNISKNSGNKCQYCDCDNRTLYILHTVIFDNTINYILKIEGSIRNPWTDDRTWSAIQRWRSRPERSCEGGSCVKCDPSMEIVAGAILRGMIVREVWSSVGPGFINRFKEEKWNGKRYNSLYGKSSVALVIMWLFKFLGLLFVQCQD